MLVDDGFEILDYTEILGCLLLEWESNPKFLNSQLYLDFLKYDVKPTTQDFEKWRDSLLEKKLEHIYTVEDLENTLNEIDEINELAKKLEEFSNIIFQDKNKKKNIVKTLQLNVKNLVVPIIPWYHKYYYLPIDFFTKCYNFMQLVADFSITFWFHIV